MWVFPLTPPLPTSFLPPRAHVREVDITKGLERYLGGGEGSHDGNGGVDPKMAALMAAAAKKSGKKASK